MNSSSWLASLELLSLPAIAAMRSVRPSSVRHSATDSRSSVGETCYTHCSSLAHMQNTH